MIALGWTKDVAATPPGTTILYGQKINVICADPSSQLTQRDRLQLQVQCFDLGVDFLPVAQLETIPAQDALELGNCSDFATTLSHLAGQGQLTISIEQPTPDASHNKSGKQWLVARKAHHDSMERRDTVLEKLTTHLGLPTSPLRYQAKASTRDILVARTACTAIHRRIAAHLKADVGAADATVTVTGLWPPFSFACAFRNIAETT